MDMKQGISSLSVIRQVWCQGGLPMGVLERTINAGNVVLNGDPGRDGQVVRSSFQITAIAQGCTAAIGLASRFYNALMDLESSKGRDGGWEKMVLETVSVDARHAIAEYKGWVRIVDGNPIQGMKVEEMLEASIESGSDKARGMLGIDEDAVADWDPLAGLYRTGPNANRSVPGVVRLHTNFPHHKLGVLQLLNLVPDSMRWNDDEVQEVFSRFDKDDVQREVEKWDAFELEAAAQRRGLCITAYRSEQEWNESEMGKALQSWMEENGGSPFRISRIPSTALSAAHTAKTSQPGHNSRKESKGLKVIDMSRVIAGPISTRSLAAHGAQVILISSPHLPNLPLLELDTARGKRTAFVHLPESGPLPAEMKELIKGADIFSQAYRPNGLAERGLSVKQVQTLRPGIVYAELCAFGFSGPWAGKRAYDSLTQTACGINYLESLSYTNHKAAGRERKEPVEPKALPVQALDYAAGSLMCFATLTCKCRAILERISGGRGEMEEGWRVQVSLASTAKWIQSFGQIHGDQAWKEPGEDVIPADRKELAQMVSAYRVRGLERSKRESKRVEGEEDEMQVLAIRHASLCAREDCDKTAEEDVRWTVPAHLGVDELKW